MPGEVTKIFSKIRNKIKSASELSCGGTMQGQMSDGDFLGKV